MDEVSSYIRFLEYDEWDANLDFHLMEIGNYIENPAIWGFNNLFGYMYTKTTKINPIEYVSTRYFATPTAFGVPVPGVPDFTFFSLELYSCKRTTKFKHANLPPTRCIDRIKDDVSSSQSIDERYKNICTNEIDGILDRYNMFRVHED